MRYGALEAGGTKMIVAIGDENGNILERASFPTLSPSETMPKMIDFFKGKEIVSLGIACFGPIDLNKESKTYGYITSTPKLEWKNYDIVGEFKKALLVPVGFDTDVNGSLLGEITWGCAKNKTDAIYLTIGTGIGGGVMTNGKLLHGMLHPEMGHMLLRPHPMDPLPQGICPYHESCLEGLASGPAVARRAGAAELGDLRDDDPVFTLEANYLAQMCVNLIVTVSPEKLILGGEMTERGFLLDLIRKETLRLLGGYVQAPEATARIDSYIVTPELAPISVLIGAWLLGRDFAG